MDFLGIGPTELIAILLILFLVMGPQDLVNIAGTLGRALRNLRQSNTWRAVQDAGRQLRELPESLVRKAGIEEIEKVQDELRGELKEQKAALKDLDHQITAWTRKPTPLSQKAKKETPSESQSNEES
ncbi:MAG: twin-arginine translocase TatA/TatE family subunit [Anaerolineales bacterium]